MAFEFKKSYLIYGGAAIAALIGGYYIYSKSVASTANNVSATPTNSLSSLYPDTIYSSGASSGSTDTSSTDALTQLLAQQQATSTQNYQLGEDTLAANSQVSLATLDTQKAIALDTNQANVEQAALSQLGSIVGSMGVDYANKGVSSHTGIGEVAGSISVQNGQINLDLGSSSFGKTLTPEARSAITSGANQQSTAQAVAAVGKS